MSYIFWKEDWELRDQAILEKLWRMSREIGTPERFEQLNRWGKPMEPYGAGSGELNTFVQHLGIMILAVNFREYRELDTILGDALKHTEKLGQACGDISGNYRSGPWGGRVGELEEIWGIRQWSNPVPKGYSFWVENPWYPGGRLGGRLIDKVIGQEPNEEPKIEVVVDRVESNLALVSYHCQPQDSDLHGWDDSTLWSSWYYYLKDPELPGHKPFPYFLDKEQYPPAE